uniref:Uncharacterized protein n=1 Tax=Arundo donax TaxID=35708 RepID=A0A0A8YJW0_ARUDO
MEVIDNSIRLLRGPSVNDENITGSDSNNENRRPQNDEVIK